MRGGKNDTGNYGKRFFGGAAALTLSAVAVKIIGVFYKIPMMKYLGASGMGYFNSAYEIYSLLFVISTAGIPVALSILISESEERGRHANSEKIYRASLIALGVIGLIGTLIMALFCREIAALIKNDSAVYCILAISPSVLFICLVSGIRGYFQGHSIMLPTALSQVIEALGKLILGVGFAIAALSRGCSVEVAAAFAVLGLTVGTAISLLYLALRSFFFTRPRRESSEPRASGVGEILVNLFKIAVPITLASAIMSTTKLIDMTMILGRLSDIGYTQEQANAVYGSYSTMALSVFNLPSAIVAAIALPLVPNLTSAIERGDGGAAKAMVNLSLKATALLAMPMGVGISAFSAQILGLLFSSQAEEIEYTAPLLSVLGASVFFSAMITVTNAVLQAYREVKRPVIGALVGVAMKLVLSYVLIGIPEINVYGAPISTFLSSLLIVLINMRLVLKKCGGLVSVRDAFLKPLFAAVLSVALGGALYYPLSLLLGSSLTILPIVALVALFYFVLVALFGVFEREEILALPMGERIYAVLCGLRLG